MWLGPVGRFIHSPQIRTQGLSGTGTTPGAGEARRPGAQETAKFVGVVLRVKPAVSAPKESSKRRGLTVIGWGAALYEGIREISDEVHLEQRPQ